MLDEIDEILEAIQQELLESARFQQFKVAAFGRKGDIWQLTVDPVGSKSALDESLEGAAAWWKGPPSGSADVLSVIPDTDQINIRFPTSRPPQPGELIRVYPPRYLDALRECWEFSGWGPRCIEWQENLCRCTPEQLRDHECIQEFPMLRRAQRQAFGLLERPVGFLWGPPGTGKTYTLGAMVARFLFENPQAKVLLFSTTNSAVDQALIKVDDQLSALTRQKPSAERIRKHCLRIGNHFIASNYDGRRHLLPAVDEALVRRLAELETQMPDPSDVVEYAKWKDEARALRRRIPKPLHDAQLAAMTTTLGAFIFESLYERAPFDLVVFDEASQVGLSHALVLAPLGKRVLFAGDDKQLAPIVQSKRRAAQQWLGRSMFIHKKTCPTCLLDEQSRMEESICDVVSNVFYDGKLVVAEGCETDVMWRSERVVRNIPPMGKKNVYVHICSRDGAFHAHHGGPVRFESADFIGDLVARLLETLTPEQIVVLTPYRAQRTVIRGTLRRRHISDVKVSTVHRAQGSESHTVIFDAVMVNNDFFDERMGGPTLINVALSRAKARLVLIASASDLEYEWIARVSTVLEHQDEPRDAALPLEEIVFDDRFPASFVGTVVRFKDWVGSIGTSSDLDCFEFHDHRTGKIRKLKLETVRRICGTPIISAGVS